MISRGGLESIEGEYEIEEPILEPAGLWSRLLLLGHGPRHADVPRPAGGHVDCPTVETQLD